MNEKEKVIGQMSHAFYTLLDRMYENMPDACGDEYSDDYAKTVAEDVEAAITEFKEAELRLKAL